MTKYNIYMERAEIPFVERKKIIQGATIDFGPDHYPELVDEYESQGDAIAGLSKYKSSVSEMRSYFLVEEYYVRKDEYSDNGEWVDGGDILAVTPLPEFEF